MGTIWVPKITAHILGSKTVWFPCQVTVILHCTGSWARADWDKCHQEVYSSNPWVTCSFCLFLFWASLLCLLPCTGAITTKFSLNFLGINHCCHQLHLTTIAWPPLCFTLSWFILHEIHQYTQGQRYKERTVPFSPSLFSKRVPTRTQKKKLIYVAANLLFLPKFSLISTGVREIKIHLTV